MKKKVVLVVGILFPSPSPPGKIALQYVNMLKDFCDLSVVYIKTNHNFPDETIIDGVNYYSITGFRFSAENYFVNHKVNFMVVLLKALGRIQSIFSINKNLNWVYKKSYRKLCDISKLQMIDIVFSVCNPFQSHLAASKFKLEHPYIRFVTYTVDSFVKGNNFSGLKKKIALKNEKNIYEIADFNFVSREIFATENFKFINFQHKTKVLDYSLVNIVKQKIKCNFDNSKINIVYAGNFYKSIRNPDFMLNSFLRLKDEKIILHLFSGGECQDIIQKYVKISNGRILKHDLVSYAEIINILNSSDILVSVSNTIKEFQPSKTFEYISIGKPIINFYSGNNRDNVLDIYPLCFQISDESMSVFDLKNFIYENYRKEISFDIVQSLYKSHTFVSVQQTLLKGVLNYE